jgi:hypothetical protein
MLGDNLAELDFPGAATPHAVAALIEGGHLLLGSDQPEPQELLEFEVAVLRLWVAMRRPNRDAVLAGQRLALELVHASLVEGDGHSIRRSVEVAIS